MIKLHLEDGRQIEFINDKDKGLGAEGLKLLFLGECSAREGDVHDECTTDYIYLTEEVEVNDKVCYVRIIKAEWDFAENAFEEYVQDWMNEKGIQGVFRILNAKRGETFECGFLAKRGETFECGFLPIHSNRDHALLLLVKQKEAIEDIINEAAEQMGIEFWRVFFDTKHVNGKLSTGASKFKLETLPLIAFEETLYGVITETIEW